MPEAPAVQGPPETLDRKAVFGWAMFDFANSSFTTVMVTAHFSIFFSKYVGSDSLWGLCGSLSSLLVMLTAPIMGALADFSGAKKKFLFATWLGCGLLTILLGPVARPEWVVPTMILFVLANFCFLSGENFISAFLPEIAPPHMTGRISGLAWGFGYVGGIGSLILSVLIMGALGEPDPENLSAGMGGYPWVWVMIGSWFLLAGIPTFLFVKERHNREPMPPGHTVWTVGFHRLKRTWIERARFRQFSRYLWAFMVYVAGVIAVINFASIIGRDMLGFTTTQLGIFLIVLNVTALVGAVSGGWLLDRVGSRKAIQLALCGWIVALLVILAVNVPEGEKAPAGAIRLFWIAGNLVGFSMGMTFASSRALAAILAPESRSAEFFGLWGLFFKAGGAIGPVTFGYAKQYLGLRPGLILLGAFFAVGLILINRVNEEEGRLAALEDRPEIS